MSDNDEELYDEFGNYIGPDLDSSSDEEDDSVPPSAPDDASDVSRDSMRDLVAREDDEVYAEPIKAIVLHEDKEHYASAEQVYGEEVRTAVLDEDAMDIETPIMEAETKKLLHVQGIPYEWNYSDDYLGAHFLNETTRNRRAIAFVGHLHHGKTSLMDLILEPTLQSGSWGPRASLDGKGPRYTDILQTEHDRQMSLASTPLTTLLTDTRGKSFCVTVMDTPGHPHFHDEAVAALRAVDAACVVVDAVEGIMMHTEMVVRQAIAEGLPLMLVLTKMDRLIVELKLPPRDAYYKLQHIIDEFNELIGRASRGRYPKVSPERGNVAFASAVHGWMFTLHSFAQVYLEHQSNDDGLGQNLSIDDFALRLWGDAYLDPETGRFQRSPRDSSTKVERTFVTFVLEPIYKIYSACLGEREADVNALLRSLGVLLKKDQLRASARPLLRAALSQFLQTAQHGFVDMVVQQCPHPAASAAGKIARNYTGPVIQEDDNNQDDSDDKYAKLYHAMKDCDPKGPLVMHAVKSYASPDGQSFWTLARIYSGTVRPATPVQVLGESYSPEDDDEDTAKCVIQGVAIPRGRFHTHVSVATAGNWVLLEGIDAHIAKTATIVEELYADVAHIFKPLSFPQVGGEAVMKLSIEPLNPAELPKMIEGLRRVSKAYPMARTKVEESGEHVVLGNGELYMDCMMHDLRHVYSDIEVKIADPMVAFRETVVESSALKCSAETSNKKNRLSLIAEPLDEGLAEELEAGKVKLAWEPKKFAKFFQTQYNWDLLSSRSVWAFGDSPTHGTNILLDDTLPSEVDKVLLNSCKSSIVQGFQWATREGPLCEEPVRGTKVKILDALLADKPIFRGGGQMIPTARRTVHAALLTASPRLLEPVLRLDIQCPGAIVGNLQSVLSRRRGHIVQDRPISGTTFYSVKGFLPMLDSFGFETDLRTFTQGQAMVFSAFDHWSVIPGDPLDKSIILHPLEPSPPPHLARELLIKTRRRKGLSEDVSMSKFLDDDMRAQLQALQEQDNME
ncbi:116 kDa U5 small nuclear ribonucleoprotein component [Fistulifera solaris]|uniref:116 kDa U5 small nuclear ribonucleoprotein component n=1 Tax=Fistulifera solaris TaxID=1519565 RepID=A0A1Z5J9M6_FISSO|nr:116 kDa U5 small nuclear ribonucleoprotein component [Fistulifera solaris]|eukprot:GAX10690.1 116 kDa U5 small nuclear ribonucleoprotein component [Fistulifera solaris]